MPSDQRQVESMIDNASIQTLVAEHGRWLMAFLRALAGDDAEDAFQEVWVRIYRRGELLRDATVKAYLAKTARSVVIDRLRRRHLEISLDSGDEAGESTADIADSAPTPAQRFESKATAADVRAAVAALPLNWRQVVLMRIEGEMDFKEIAAELGVPLGTVLTWMHRATVELKRKIGGMK